jgi:septum site-determining protein MinD
MKKVIGFFSGKGGTGKTTCTVNTGLAIHQFGEKVVLLDCDFDNANLSLHLGLYDFPLTLHDVIDKDINILEAVHIHSSGLRFIPASISFRQMESDISKLKTSLSELDYVTLLDCPPGINNTVLSLLNMCDEVLVVTNPDMPAVTDALKVIQKALDLGKSEISVIVNKSGKKHELKIDEIEEACKVPVLGSVPAKYDFHKSLHHKVPLLLSNPYSHASVAFKKIGSSLVGKEYKQPKFLALRRFFVG